MILPLVAAVCAVALLTAASARPIDAAPPEARKPKAAKKAAARPIRLAVYDFDTGEAASGPGLSDGVAALLAACDGIEFVNREDLAKVAEGHRLGLSGLVEPGAAVKLGRFVATDIVVVGRASRIGGSDYLIVKLIDVATTVPTTVAVKAPAGGGDSALLDRLAAPLGEAVGKLRLPADASDPALAALRKAVRPLQGRTFLIDVTEEHVSRPLRDPAAELAVAERLWAAGRAGGRHPRRRAVGLEGRSARQRQVRRSGRSISGSKAKN